MREQLLKISKELNLPLVATNDCHYSLKQNWEAHDVMFCLGTGKDRDDPKRQRYATQEFYFKSQDEMWKLFKNYPGAIENSRLISDSCNIELPLGEYLLPKFPIPEKYNSHSPGIIEWLPGLKLISPNVQTVRSPLLFSNSSLIFSANSSPS